MMMMMMMMMMKASYFIRSTDQFKVAYMMMNITVAYMEEARSISRVNLWEESSKAMEQ